LALLELHQLFNTRDYLTVLSNSAREILLAVPGRDRAWVSSGTEPKESNFRAFNITAMGLLLTFQEYQVDCYAAGPQTVEIPIKRIAQSVSAKAYLLWPNGPSNITMESDA
jgi:hypothetical protein